MAKDILDLSIPTLLILAGLFFNNRQAEKAEDRLNRRLDLIDGRLTLIQGDLTRFYSITGTLQGRLDELSKGGR